MPKPRILHSSDELAAIVSFKFRHISFFAISEPLLDVFWGMFNTVFMYMSMFCLGNYHKVLRPIVVLNTVKMMHDFIFAEVTPKPVLYYQSMLAYISLISGVGMLRSMEIDVSASNYFTTLPLRVRLSGSLVATARTVLSSSVLDIRARYKELYPTSLTYAFNVVFIHNNNYRLGIV